MDTIFSAEHGPESGRPQDFNDLNRLIIDEREDFFSRTADAIITKRKALKLKPYVPPAPKVKPEPEPLPTTLAGAYSRGFEAAADAAGHCCGCNVYQDQTNPYDGTPL